MNLWNNPDCRTCRFCVEKTKIDYFTAWFCTCSEREILVPWVHRHFKYMRRPEWCPLLDMNAALDDIIASVDAT